MDDDVIGSIIKGAEERLLKVAQKEKLNYWDNLKMMIYTNIFRVFSKIGEIKCLR